jgi:hypothetical protein
MSDTVAQIGNAAAEIVGLPRQTTFVGNSNQNAIKILRAVKDAGRDASRSIDWVVLRREHTFTTDASSSYALPAYYDRLINNTIWDRTNYRRLIGPVEPSVWQLYKSGSLTIPSLNKVFRFAADSSGNKVIEIYPDTDTGSSLAFEYLDSRSIKSSVGDLQEDIVADTDYFIIDDEVVEAATVWRLLKMLGLSYQTEFMEYQALIEERRANESGGQVLSMSLNSVYLGVDPNVPDTGYGV